MFATFDDKPSNCFLLDECNTNTTSCRDTPDCNFSVSGPKTPSIPDACCQEFKGVICDMESEVGHFYDVAEAPKCQSLCRDTSNCSYWSLYGEICFLYSTCNHPHPCSSLCTSGPVFPDISVCEGYGMIYDTLLIGGRTSVEDYTSSLELITQNRTCTPQMDQTPLAKIGAGAVLLGSKIIYCGGVQDGIHVSTCHSFDLDQGGWQDEPSMVEARSYFGLSLVADRLIASGGYVGGAPSSSVEIFIVEESWRRQPKLDMSAPRDGHCSVVWGSWLYTSGGRVGGGPLLYSSNLVEAIDTSDNSPSWLKKANMSAKRYGHACHVGAFDGHEGIHVAGGLDDYYNMLTSAEFYNFALDNWQKIGSLISGRGYSQMTMLGRDLIVSGGGYDFVSSVETWTGSRWVELEENRLEEGRFFHAAVCIKTGTIFCNQDDE